MKILKTILKVLVMGAVTPIILVIAFIYGFKKSVGKLSVTSEADANSFMSDFIDKFNNEIATFLQIQETPEIRLISDRKVSGFNNGNLLGEFSTAETESIVKNFAYSMFANHFGTKYEEKQISPYINIYYHNIFHTGLGNKIIIKFMTINTIMHELTHYMQYKNNTFSVKAPSACSTFDNYLNQNNEVEARNSAMQFERKYFFRILKFVLFNK